MRTGEQVIGEQLKGRMRNKMRKEICFTLSFSLCNLQFSLPPPIPRTGGLTSPAQELTRASQLTVACHPTPLTLFRSCKK